MILSTKNRRLLWLSYSIFNLFLIGTFLISPKKELILYLVPVLFFIAGFTDKRKQFIKQFIGFCLRVVPFLLFLYLYWIVQHLPIEYIHNLTLSFSLPAIAISAVYVLIASLMGFLVRQAVSDKKPVRTGILY